MNIDTLMLFGKRSRSFFSISHCFVNGRIFKKVVGYGKKTPLELKFHYIWSGPVEWKLTLGHYIKNFGNLPAYICCRTWAGNSTACGRILVCLRFVTYSDILGLTTCSSDFELPEFELWEKGWLFSWRNLSKELVIDNLESSSSKFVILRLKFCPPSGKALGFTLLRMLWK